MVRWDGDGEVGTATARRDGDGEAGRRRRGGTALEGGVALLDGTADGDGAGGRGAGRSLGYGGGGRARPLGVEGGAGVSRAGQKSAGRARRGITLEDEGETLVLDGTADGDGADVANSEKVPPEPLRVAAAAGALVWAAVTGASASVWAEASAGWLALWAAASAVASAPPWVVASAVASASCVTASAGALAARSGAAPPSPGPPHGRRPGGEVRQEASASACSRWQ